MSQLTVCSGKLEKLSADLYIRMENNNETTTSNDWGKEVRTT